MQVESPYQQFFDLSGAPLEDGRIYIGTTNLNPETNPVAIYWDAAGTQPAAQPLKTSAGYIVRNGTPSRVYLAATDFSIVIRDKTDSLVLSALSVTSLSNLQTDLSLSSGASMIGFIQSGSGAVASTVESKLRQELSVLDFGAKGDGITDDAVAFSNSVLSGAPVLVPKTANFYNLSALSTATKELLYGPGIVKVLGAPTPIPAVASITNPDSAAINVFKSALAPTTNTTLGSVGEGAINTVVIRSGGKGQYGNWLSSYLVNASMVPGEFDVGVTSWIGATNMTGAGTQVFGSWFGANTPAKNLDQTFAGGAAIGMEVNVGNRWANYANPVDVGSTRYTVGMQVVPDVLPALDGVNSVACTISVGTPAVVTLNSHGFIANQGVVFGGAGTLPIGITAGATYFVMAAGLGANTFQISSTIGGAAVNTTGSFAAPVTVLPSYAAGFGVVIGSSIHGHAWWNGTLLRYDSIVAGGYGHIDYGGSVAANSPAAVNMIGGYWVNGIDFAGAVFSGAAINFSFSNQTAATATAGSVASPGNYQGFIKVAISGTIVKIPYFQN